jgi:hypothetical protein
VIGREYQGARGDALETGLGGARLDRAEPLGAVARHIGETRPDQPLRLGAGFGLVLDEKSGAGIIVPLTWHGRMLRGVDTIEPITPGDRLADATDAFQGGARRDHR